MAHLVELRTVAAAVGAPAHDAIENAPLNDTLLPKLIALHEEGRLFKRLTTLADFKCCLKNPAELAQCTHTINSSLTPDAQQVMAASRATLPWFYHGNEMQNQRAMIELGVSGRVADADLTAQVRARMGRDDVRVLVLSGASGSGKTFEAKSSVPLAVAGVVQKPVHVLYTRLVKAETALSEITDAHKDYIRAVAENAPKAVQDAAKAARDGKVTLFDNLRAAPGVFGLMADAATSQAPPPVLLVVLDEAGSTPAALCAIASRVSSGNPIEGLDVRVCFVGTGAEEAASRIAVEQGDAAPVSGRSKLATFRTSQNCTSKLLRDHAEVSALAAAFPLVRMFAENRRGIMTLKQSILDVVKSLGVSGMSFDNLSPHAQAEELLPEHVDSVVSAMRNIPAAIAQRILDDAIVNYTQLNAWRDVTEKAFHARMVLARAAVSDVDECSRAVDDAARLPTPPQQFESHAVVRLGCLQWSEVAASKHPPHVTMPRSMCVVAMYLAGVLPPMTADFQGDEPWEVQAGQWLGFRALGLRAYWPSDMQRRPTVWDLLSLLFSKEREATGPRARNTKHRRLMKRTPCTLPAFVWTMVAGAFGVAQETSMGLPWELSSALDEATSPPVIQAMNAAPGGAYLLQYLNAPGARFWDAFLFTPELLVVWHMKDWADSVLPAVSEAEVESGGVVAASLDEAEASLTYLQGMNLRRGKTRRLVVTVMAAARGGVVPALPWAGEHDRVIREVGLVSHATKADARKNSSELVPMLEVLRAAKTPPRTKSQKSRASKRSRGK